MRRRTVVSVVGALCVLLVGVAIATAQGPDTQQATTLAGSTFTYQGRLTDSDGAPVTDTCDFSATLYADAGGTTQVATTDPPATTVTDGRFTIDLDFGAGAFDGNARWLELVADCGDGAKTFPLQRLTPTPYALFAARTPWSGVTGVPADIADGDDDTTYSAGTGLSLSGGTFSLDAGYTDGRYWRQGGNAGTTTGTDFLGTTDAVDLTLAVSDTAALRLQPADGAFGASPNIIGGASGNDTGTDVYGATIGGGGAGIQTNYADGDFATIAGGLGNYASGFRATIGGGGSNQASLNGATVGGGANNEAAGNRATVAGGHNNAASSDFATVAGGNGNTANSTDATVSGGFNNTASAGGAIVGGGKSNTSDGANATVGGGYVNSAGANLATIGGGKNNIVTAAGDYATVPGGQAAAASHYGEMAYASGSFSSPGDAQTSVYVLRNTTTDGTLTELFLDGSSERLTIADGRTVTLDILVVARSTGGESAGYKGQGVIENDGGVGFIGGPPAINPVGEDDSVWGVTVGIINDIPRISVYGNTGDTIRWAAYVRTVEVAGP